MSDFDKYLLTPQYSDLGSRKEAYTDVQIAPNLTLEVPIISSPMSTVTELEMAQAMANVGGAGAVHRYLSIEEQSNILRKVDGPRIASIGVNGDARERVSDLIEVTDMFVLDVAHGDMKGAHDMVEWIKEQYGETEVSIMSGNIVTKEAAERAYSAGVDAFRVAVGPGSGCITRTVAGVGRNSIEAIQEIKDQFPSISIVNDGGIKTSGDLVKVLAAGASATFMGGQLVATIESPADVILKDYKTHKIYAGMASTYSERRRLKRTGEEGEDIDHIRAPEGKVVYVPYDGKHVYEVVEEFIGGIKHGMAYLGARSIPEMWQKAKGAWTVV